MLKDKVVIVTGGTSGIGRETARLIARRGGKVLVHGLDEPAGRPLVNELGAAAALCIADLARPESAARIVDAALAAFGRLDGLVNNAAFIPRSGIADTDPALFDQCMAVNARAPLLLIAAALEHLSQTRGSVVNVGSVNAHCGEPDLLAYSISKGALQTLTRNLGDTLHRQFGVRVNQINPGWVGTENEHAIQLRLGRPSDWQQRLGPAVAPSGSLIPPATIAGAIVYWLSDESRPISGTVMDMEQFPVIGRNLKVE